MSRDPFEELQRQNPVAPDERPPAPMSVADRIVRRRERRPVPGWALAAASMVVVAIVGGALLAWLSSGEQAPVGGTVTTVIQSTAPVEDSTSTSIAAQCSGALVEGDLAGQSELPQAVADLRVAIWEAATACDWDGLQSLLGRSFAYSYGGQDDAIDAPIHHWQALEAAGEQPMRFLAELLRTPFGTMDGGEGATYYVWPSAHAKAWDEVTADEREALAPLYDEAALAGFAEFGGYYGYRIGIHSDAGWSYFIAGD